MTILRVACYERVSTEDQALRGFSIEAQIDNLTEYCEKKGMKIVAHYTDEGKSGSLPPLKRPALHRLLEDVQAGKIDMILFTKLDRWFRSVQEYFKVQDILDSHKVEWKAIHEDYDTTTANGRMAITIFLAIAQNERERTAERIKVVFEHKRKNKEACFGGKNPPFGYLKQKDEDGIMRLVKDPETQHIVAEFWDILIKYENIKKAIRHVRDVYGIVKSDKQWGRIAKSPFYCGVHDEIDDFCEPYVTKENWLRVQENTQQWIRSTKENRVYIFSGMMRCPKCGNVLCGTFSTKKYSGVEREYRTYRCRFKGTDCNYTRNLSELKIEKQLIAKLKGFIEQKIADVELERTKPKPKPKYNIPALKERLRRLNVTYMAGNIGDDEYHAADAEIKALLAKAEDESPPPEQDLEKLKQLLETDIRHAYFELDAEEKRRFLRNFIKEIKLDDNKVCSVVFKY